MLDPAPNALLDSNGKPLYGRYRGTVEDTSMDGLTTVPRWLRLAGQKRWIYVGVFSPRFIVGAAVVDVTYLANGFAFAFDRQSGEMLEHHRLAPRLRRRVPDSPVEGVARFSLPWGRVVVDSAVARGERWLRAAMGRGRQRLELDLKVEDDERRYTPLSVISPLAGGRPTVTRKGVGLPATGTVRIGAHLHTLRDALAVVDYSHSLPEHHTTWLWAAGAGRTADGRALGLNLVSGWNNQQHGENAVWLEGRLIPLGRATFLRQADCWRIESDLLSLRFYPEGERSQQVEAGPIVSRYVQPVGRFTGQLDDDGRTVTLGEVYGVTEDHEARW